MTQKPTEKGSTKKEKKRKKLGVFKWTLIIVLVAFIGTASYYGYAIWDFANGIQSNNQNPEPPDFIDSDQNPEPVYVPPQWDGKERVNILLMGIDRRGDESTSRDYSTTHRSDSMMLLSIDPVTKKGHLFSLLRDSYVAIPGRGSSRLNAATVFGGPELAMETVSEFTGLDVQYYVAVDFEGFVALVDAIGGVEFHVERDMRYITQADGPDYDIDLQEGLQVLDGRKALQYARFRYDARGDYARTERQRELAKAVVDKMQSTYSLVRLPNILREVQPHIETNMTVNNMLRLATLGYEIRNETFESIQLPPPGLFQEQVINDAQVLVFDQARIHAYIEEALAEKEEVEEVEADESSPPQSAAHSSINSQRVQ